MTRIFLFAFAFTFSVAHADVRPAPNPDKKVRIIALTDFHGALEATVTKTKDNLDVRSGGAAMLASYVDKVRNQDTIPSIVIDAGDLFQGSLVSNTVEGRPVVDFYNYLGLDAAAIGNHDFDYGPEGKNAMPKAPGEDPRGALKARMKQANFAFLAANIRDKDEKSPDWAKGSVIIERQGIRIGIIGAATTRTPETTLRQNVADLHFLEPAPEIIREAAELRKANVDYVVVAIHAGGGCKKNDDHSHKDLSSCEQSEVFDVINAMPAGTVDAVVAGHTHKGVVKIVNGTPTLQSYSHGRYVSWVELSKKAEPVLHAPVATCQDVVRTSQGDTCNSYDVKNLRGPVYAAKFMGEEMQPDPRVHYLLLPDFERVEEMKSMSVGGLSVASDFVRSYYDENALGNMLADTYLAYYKKMADTVLLNNGGLRDNLAPGPLTFGDIFAVLPFDNQLALVTVPGHTLRQIIELGISRKNGGISWGGLRFSADLCKVTSAEVNGAPIEDLRMYRILTADFIATGGIGFNGLGIPASQIQILDDYPVMRDAMVEAMTAVKPTLQSSLYYDEKAPRQVIKNICPTTNVE
jgi:5'-nucleotidase